jgi:hypothetical protein
MTLPVTVTRTMADSHRPVCRPKPAGPVTREGARPQISVYVEKPIPRAMPFARCSARSASKASRSIRSMSLSSAPA